MSQLLIKKLKEVKKRLSQQEDLHKLVNTIDN